ncbi:MAG: CDP-glycerol glycerophosphotransferase family protein [Theionarchaea archaeon]|nr:CDP-glycerol glycerophosphotransferase family protein [Theionarchaea archaeon]
MTARNNHYNSQKYEDLIKTKLTCGKSLVELTTYENVVMWWIVDLGFYLSVNKIARKADAKPIRRNLPRVVHEPVEFLLDISRVLLIRVLTRIFRRKRENKQSRTCNFPKILFIAQDLQWRIIRDYETNSMKKSDAFFDSIIKLAEGKYTLEGIFPLNPSILSLRTFFDKLRTWHISHTPFDMYWSLTVWEKKKESSKHFKEAWRLLASDEKFKELCEYDEKNIYELVEKELKYYFYFLFPLVVKHIEMTKRMIEKEDPNLILLLNEYGNFERAVLIAGKEKRVPTAAIQHGIITPTHRGYIFGKEERGKIVLPDMTCVYGQYHYNLLTKNSIYEPTQVTVTGQPRYDILYHADRIYSKEQFLKTYGINPIHKIVLWATQCHGLTNEENKKSFKAVFETMRSVEDVTLVVKQHPGEGEAYSKMIEEWLGAFKINAVLTPKSSDMYEQLFVCDAMITKNSTTAMEAIALDKPVVILNLSEEPDVVDYVPEGVASGVYREEDLKPTLLTLLKDSSELAKNRKKYIEKYLYRIDGKASKRVVNLMENLIRRGEKNEL